MHTLRFTTAFPASIALGILLGSAQVRADQILGAGRIDDDNVIQFPGGPSFGRRDTSSGVLDLGSVGLKLKNAPVIQSFAKSIAATPAKFYGYGYIGDGSSHPLHSIKCLGGATPTATPCLDGTPTDGWTLARWQAILPATVALTDEADWVAIQSVINGATSSLDARIPPGSTAIVNRPLVSGCQAISFSGGGGLQTKIVQTSANTDLIQHALNGSPCPITASSRGKNFQVRDLSLECAVNGCGYALNVNLEPTTGQYIVSNVTMTGGTGSISTGFFKNCSNVRNPSLVYIEHADCIGNYSGGAGSLATVNDAFAFTSGPSYAGAATGSYYLSLNDVNVRFMRRCFVFTMPAATSAFTGGIEGVVGNALNCTAALDGIVIANNAYSTSASPVAAAQYYRAPQWFFHDSQFEVYRQFLNARYVANLKVHHNLVYLSASNPASGAIAANDKVQLVGLSEAQFDHNTYVIAPRLAYNDVYHTTPSSEIASTIGFDHESFGLNAPPAAAIYVVDAGSREVAERASTFHYASGIAGTKVLNRSDDPSVRMEAQFLDLGGRLLSDGSVAYSASGIGTTDSRGTISFPIPIGLYRSPPQVIAVNGDIGASASLCAPTGIPTPTSFSVQCFSAGSSTATPAGTNVRINWSAVGR